MDKVVNISIYVKELMPQYFGALILLHIFHTAILIKVRIASIEVFAV